LQCAEQEETTVKRLIRAFVVFLAVTSALRAAGAWMGRRFEAGAGTPDADDLRLAAIWGGRDLRSRAGGLRSVTARTVLGGVNLDLTGAVVDPAGAEITLDVRLGGVNLGLPAGVRAEVEDRLQGGQVALALQDPAEIPDDAPPVKVVVEGFGAGVNIESSR
jgi:hypothetical protein